MADTVDGMTDTQGQSDMPRDAVTCTQGWAGLVPGMGVTGAQGWK